MDLKTKSNWQHLILNSEFSPILTTDPNKRTNVTSQPKSLSLFKPNMGHKIIKYREGERKTISRKHEIILQHCLRAPNTHFKLCCSGKLKITYYNERCQFLCFKILPNTMLIKYFVMTAFCLKILSTVIRKCMKSVSVRKTVEAWDFKKTSRRN